MQLQTENNAELIYLIEKLGLVEKQTNETEKINTDYRYYAESRKRKMTIERRNTLSQSPSLFQV